MRLITAAVFAMQRRQPAQEGGKLQRPHLSTGTKCCLQTPSPKDVRKIHALLCKQMLFGILLGHYRPTIVDSQPGFNYTGDEDCLFLSVYAPQNKTNLPVFVWIRKLCLPCIVFLLPWRQYGRSFEELHCLVPNLSSKD